MGRKYTRIQVRSKDRALSGIMAFIDCGSDLTIISTKVAKRLKIKPQNIERKWTASDGDERYSPITEIEVRAEDDDGGVVLDDILIEDSPLDKESGEEVVLGLDYLQKTKKTLRFDD